VAKRRASFLARAAVVGIVLIGAALIGPVSSGAASSGTSPGPTKTVWLCRPGVTPDPCETSLDTTVVKANGQSAVMDVNDAKNPKIDCFYVYPTISAEPMVNADLTIQPAEIGVAEDQAARFSEDCKVYSPMYNQLTLGALDDPQRITAANLVEAYQSALSGFKDYLAHYNHDRGIVFIGHSQGATILIQLLKDVVDPNPKLRRLVVSAILLGGNVTVPIGKSVGGDFKHIPACQADNQTGCVVAYSSFLDPPPADSYFGRVGQGVSLLSGPGQGPNPRLRVLCTNPAALGGGSGLLQPYFLGGTTTRWLSYPGLYSAQCMSVGGATWLQVTPISTPGDTRPLVAQQLGPQWGLHLLDVNMSLGNFVSLVATQAKAYLGHP
jgi:hypothetical protein